MQKQCIENSDNSLQVLLRELTQDSKASISGKRIDYYQERWKWTGTLKVKQIHEITAPLLHCWSFASGPWSMVLLFVAIVALHLEWWSSQKDYHLLTQLGSIWISFSSKNTKETKSYTRHKANQKLCAKWMLPVIEQIRGLLLDNSCAWLPKIRVKIFNQG